MPYENKTRPSFARSPCNIPFSQHVHTEHALQFFLLRKWITFVAQKKEKKRGRESDGEREKSLNRIYSNGFKLSKFAIIEREV